MKIRRATEADEAVLRELWEEFEREVPEPIGSSPRRGSRSGRDTLDDIAAAASSSPRTTTARSASRASRRRSAASRTSTSSTSRPRARRQGVAKALLAACTDDAKARGAQHVSPRGARRRTSRGARGVAAARLRRPSRTCMATPIAELEARLAERRSARSVRRRTCRPTTRSRSSARSPSSCRGSRQPQRRRASDSWIRVVDPILDHDRDAHGRFAKELSERLGAVTVALAQEGDVVRFRLYERGRMVDEYLSVPTYYGELPKGDELALEANPTLVARLTGADRDEVRRLIAHRGLAGRPPPARPVRADRGADGPRRMKLIDAPRCPYCARVRIALAEKGIEHETRRGRPRRPPAVAARAEPALRPCPCSRRAARSPR